MLIEEATQSGAREKMACKELGISQRTLQRWKNDATPLEDQRPAASRPTPKNKLSEEEILVILEVVNQPEFQSLPPSQIVPILADREIYLASESTFYRVLRRHNMQYHRGRSKAPSSWPISTHCATGPNQVWIGISGWKNRRKMLALSCAARFYLKNVQQRQNH
jgi:putative transposase